MSGPISQSEAERGASTIELQAAQFIERRDCSTWTDQDQVEFEAWIAASPAHRIGYLRMDAGWKRAERLAALRPRKDRWRDQAIVPIVGKSAAAFGLIALLGAGALYYASLPHYSTYATNLGERETLTLRDGSRIELNTDTVVQISNDRDRRHVRLERGEAYFEIVHDAAHPFVVSAGRGLVTDVGTKFVVRRDAQQLQVTLLQGAARFDSTGGSEKPESIVLHPGEAVVATADGFSVAKKPEQETARETSWRRGVLVFSDTPLARAAAEFNRYNRIKIIVNDPKAAKVGIGGTFATANVLGFVRVAQGLLGLHVESRDDEIVISH